MQTSCLLDCPYVSLLSKANYFNVISGMQEGYSIGYCATLSQAKSERKEKGMGKAKGRSSIESFCHYSRREWLAGSILT